MKRLLLNLKKKKILNHFIECYDLKYSNRTIIENENDNDNDIEMNNTSVPNVPNVENVEIVDIDTNITNKYM